VPLFVEELTKMVLESGLVIEADDHYELFGLLPPLAIPSTLQDSLMARLDRLAPVRDIAQLGAALGREFSYELLQAVSPLDEVPLQQGLKQLVEAELLYQRGIPPQAIYLVSRPRELPPQPLAGRVESWRAHGRWRVSSCALSIAQWGHNSTLVTFPAPATSNGACGFPALRFPVDFTPRVMRPLRLGALSTPVRPAALGSG
jgi:hypothetical protein